MDTVFALLICFCLIGFWIMFNWKDTLKDHHRREKNRQWEKKLSKFKKRYPDADTSKIKYKIKKNK